MTQRWKITIEYDGRDFAGWQRQDTVPSVQQAIEDAIFKYTNEKITLTVAGRTDAGVHAVGQVAHFDLEKNLDEKAIRDATNFHIRPARVAILKAKRVGSDFNARRSAIHRVYCYRLIAGRRPDPMIEEGRVWNVGYDLDVAAMNKAASYLVGQHDFSTFRDSQCQANSPVRSLQRLEVIENQRALCAGKHLEIWAEAPSFLHHQIRNITGTLALVGQRKWTPEDVKIALEARDRTKGGPTAPPDGLYFMRVDYTDTDLIRGADSML